MRPVSCVYACPKVTKYQVYQFFMSTKNLHIKSFTLIPSRLVFMSRWKFTHQVYYIVISCQFFFKRKYIFVDQVSCFDIKFLIFVWNTIFPLPSQLRQRNKKYMSSLYFHKSRRPGDDPVKRARAVWKLRALKFNMAVTMNFITTWRSFLKLILSLRCSTKATHVWNYEMEIKRSSYLED